MKHPVVEQIERTGFPLDIQEPEIYGTDALGNEVVLGDTIYVFNDEFFLKDTLLQESIELLEVLGAEEKTA
ncbi:hypothetical protein SAMN05421743_105192 [Thalassobacillus cyri]|uniref:YqaI-like protein n=1 Tax=Thalassobacillus cyri TaxID=571932 RepID=A0A1H4BXY9_9BACI|nr:hypothetical protein [Thalassobacillus cyri]SEA53041.1 hypothetical protein SAMN05421743_105192 [Thalassobacillus cyri]